MDGPIQVEVTRGDVVEAVHRVHAVAVDDGRVVAVAGDTQLVTFLRSSAKPLQALPLVRARPDVGDREVAIACASHMALPEQLDVVRSLLAAAPATEDELETGPAPTPIQHTCSGKHAGFLAVCRSKGFDVEGYRFATHPFQEELIAELAETAGTRPSDLPLAADGCGVPTFALTLERCALLFAQLPKLAGGDRIASAMSAHPEMLEGPIDADVKFVRSLPDWAGKGGAEGLFCAWSSDGRAVVLKVEDGSYRPILPALAGFLTVLGVPTGELGVVPVENSHGERVGEVKIRPKSRVPNGR
jgi:L-asparaginase